MKKNPYEAALKDLDQKSIKINEAKRVQISKDKRRNKIVESYQAEAKQQHLIEEKKNLKVESNLTYSFLCSPLAVLGSLYWQFPENYGMKFFRLWSS